MVNHNTSLETYTPERSDHILVWFETLSGASDGVPATFGSACCAEEAGCWSPLLSTNCDTVIVARIRVASKSEVDPSSNPNLGTSKTGLEFKKKGSWGPFDKEDKFSQYDYLLASLLKE
jgi:hypothetical protein